MSSIGVVHLVRKENGIEPFRNFLESYRNVEAGVEHDLIIIFKGFAGESGRRPFAELLDGTQCKTLDAPEGGFDIGPYCRAAAAFDYSYFCFLNSFSAIPGNDWLYKLFRAVSKEGVGLAGATGSYQSFTPSSLKSYVALSRQIKNRGPVKNMIMALPFAPHLNFYRLRLRYGPRFRHFPNYHIRTNAFMVPKDVMTYAASHRVRSKMDAYRFESGKHSLTTQVMEAGLRAVVVGADGEAYEKEEWHQSNTFWQDRQQNLLVEDNQTRHYAKGTGALRNVLSRFAWGQFARPS